MKQVAGSRKTTSPKESKPQKKSLKSGRAKLFSNLQSIPKSQHLSEIQYQFSFNGESKKLKAQPQGYNSRAYVTEHLKEDSKNYSIFKSPQNEYRFTHQQEGGGLGSQMLLQEGSELMSDQYELPEEAIPTEIEENGGHLHSRPDFEVAGNRAIQGGAKNKHSFYTTDTLKLGSSKSQTKRQKSAGRIHKETQLTAGKGLHVKITDKGQPKLQNKKLNFEPSQTQMKSPRLDRPDTAPRVIEPEELGSLSSIKTSLMHIFQSYGDFNLKGDQFLTHSCFLRIVRDSGITVNENRISIMMSSVLQTKTNLIKQINFEQFLDLLSALSELNDPEMFTTSPKRALKLILSCNLIPLLRLLQSKNGLKKFGTIAAFSNCLQNQAEIVYNDDTKAIMSDIMPLLRQLYIFYFEEEQLASKSKDKINVNELKMASLNSCFNFLKDFMICPYLINRKTCFAVWHEIKETIGSRHSVKVLTNNDNQKSIISTQVKDQGQLFTLSHFVILFYRISILAFDHSSSTSDKYSDFNLVKKLLFQLRFYEQQDEFLQFINRVGRTYTKTLSFLPSRDLLAQIIICEKLDRFISGRTIESFPKEDLLNRIMEGDLYIECDQQTSKHKTVSQQEELTHENQIGYSLEKYQGKLKAIFQYYASYGEPGNITHLKSSKLQKLVADAGLTSGVSDAVKGSSVLQQGYVVRQQSRTEIDLLFALVCSKNHQDLQRAFSGNNREPRNASPGFLSNGNIRQSNTNPHKLSQRSVHSTLWGLNTISLTPSRIFATLDTSSMIEGSALSPAPKQVSVILPKADKFDFTCFIKFIIKLGIKCFPGIEQKTQGVILTVEKFILPLLNSHRDQRTQQSTLLSKLISLVNSQVIVNFMSDLHQVLGLIYVKYTDNHNLMTFDYFLQFAKDHDIFPTECSKAALYCIFNQLSNIKDSLNPSASLCNSKRELSDLDISHMSPRGLEKLYTQLRVQKIDQNLFTEAVTLMAIFKTDDKKLQLLLGEYQTEEPSFELERACLKRCLNLVRKINESDGKISSQVKQLKESTTAIKLNLQDRHADLIDYFQRKKNYKWYFDQFKSVKKRFTPFKSKPNFQQVMSLETSHSHDTK